MRKSCGGMTSCCKKRRINVNVNSREFSRLYNVHPLYWNSLLYGLISSGATTVMIAIGKQSNNLVDALATGEVLSGVLSSAYFGFKSISKFNTTGV